MTTAVAANVVLFTASMTILTGVGRFTVWAIHLSIMQRRLESGFVAITGRTGKAEILENCLATNRTGDNVFKLKNCNRQSFSRAAIGAANSKMGTNLSL